MSAIPADPLVATVSLEEALTPRLIQALVAGEVLAIVVHGFTDPTTCEFIAERLVRDQRLTGYDAAEEGLACIKILGMPLVETAGRDPQERERYYAQAMTSIRALRDLVRPAPYPMDLIRLALQECWPAGADFETLGTGRKGFVGMPRVFENGSATMPHCDRLAWDVPDMPAARTHLAQLAANAHLRTAASGGELEFWKLCPSTEEYDRLRKPGTYGLESAKLPPPAAVVRPQAGDFILFNSHRVHRVRECHGQPRVTVSCFIGYRGPYQPLCYWS
jgi:hypothetical protein